MAELNFPANPQSGDTYDFGNVRYRYDGIKWTSIATNDKNIVQEVGDALAITDEKYGGLVNENLTINSTGTIIQVGPAINNGGWVCDMWVMGGCGGLADSVFTGQRVYDTTQYARGSHQYLALAFNRAGTLNNTHAPNMTLKVPRSMATPLFGKTFTVSFWVAATKSGTYSVTVRSRNSLVCYVHPYTLVANTWTKITFTVKDGLPTANATDHAYWGDSNALAYSLTFCAGFVGSDYITSTPDAWSVGSNKLGVAAQSNNNSMLAVGDMMKITSVKVELGETATPHIPRNPMVELAMCKHYYEEVRFADTGMTSTALSSTSPWYKRFEYSIKAVVPTITTKGTPALSNITAISYVGIDQYGARLAYTWTAGPNIYAYDITAIVDARSILS